MGVVKWRVVMGETLLGGLGGKVKVGVRLLVVVALVVMMDERES